MSNARYFADGTEYYRVKYNTGAVDGPYIKIYAAKRVGESGIKVRRRYDYKGNVVHEWQNYTSYKIQQLMPVFEECMCCLTLEWQDV